MARKQSGIKALVVGAGIGGLSLAEELTRSPDVDHTFLMARSFGTDTTSPSGGLVLPFLSSDRRVPGWSVATGDWWPNRFAVLNPALARYVGEVPTLLLSQDASIPTIAGHLGAEKAYDPRDIGFPYYRSAMVYDQGIVISTCGLLNEWTEKFMNATEATVIPTQVLSMEEIISNAKNFGAEVVFLAVGAGAYDILGDHEIEGVEGILLQGPAVDKASVHNQFAVMARTGPTSSRTPSRTSSVRAIPCWLAAPEITARWCRTTRMATATVDSTRHNGKPPTPFSSAWTRVCLTLRIGSRSTLGLGTALAAGR